MKPCEYTIKVITDGPIDPSVLLKAIDEAATAVAVSEVVRFRVVPTPKKAKS